MPTKFTTEYIKLFKTTPLRKRESFKLRTIIKEAIKNINQDYTNYDNIVKCLMLFKHYASKRIFNKSIAPGAFYVYNYNMRKLFKDLRKYNIYEFDYIMSLLRDNNIITLVKEYSNYENNSNCRYFIINEDFIEYISQKNIYIATDIVIPEDFFTEKVYNENEKYLHEFLINNTRLNITDGQVYDLCDNLKLTSRQVESVLHSVNAFRDKKIWVSQDENTNRIYSSFSNMNAELRKYVQIKKNNKWHYLNEIDLKCAQPLLLSFLIKDTELFDIVSNDIYNYLIEKQPATIFTCDWNKSKNIVEEIIITNKLSRKEMKEYFYKFLFDTKVKPNGVVYQLLNQYLPHILNKVIIKKREKKDTGLNLAQQLQAAEAKIMNEVYYKIKNSSLPLCDAIYVTDDLLDNTIKDIKNEFKINNFIISNNNLNITINNK